MSNEYQKHPFVGIQFSYNSLPNYHILSWSKTDVDPPLYPSSPYYSTNMKIGACRFSIEFGFYKKSFALTRYQGTFLNPKRVQIEEQKGFYYFGLQYLLFAKKYANLSIMARLIPDLNGYGIPHYDVFLSKNIDKFCYSVGFQAPAM